MQSKRTKCIKGVGEKSCPYCHHRAIIKNGRSKQGKQRYQCKQCSRSFLFSYVNYAYQTETNEAISRHIKEGCGIRSIARLLKISVATVLKRILSIAKTIKRPVISFGKEYELDELCTYVKRKNNHKWIVYAIRKDNKEVINFVVGCRTMNTLQRVTDTLVLSDAGKIYTDKLRQYASLLPE